MNHRMKLDPVPFARMKAGQKTVELRLNDEKRRRVRVGDTITFTDTGSGEELTVTVTALHPFPGFSELFAALGTAPCGGPVDMDRYYAPEDQKKWGVLGIEISQN